MIAADARAGGHLCEKGNIMIELRERMHNAAIAAFEACRKHGKDSWEHRVFVAVYRGMAADYEAACAAAGWPASWRVGRERDHAGEDMAAIVVKVK